MFKLRKRDIEKRLYLRLLLVLFNLTLCVYAHGRMDEPSSRNSAWRYGFKSPENYNDCELNCGGAGRQHARNGGKCGVCGDPYDDLVKQHERGGQYATGTIVRTYNMGQHIKIGINITSNHLGTMEFRLCPLSDVILEATQECLDQYVLNLTSHGLKYHVPASDRQIWLEAKLPDNLTCAHCVLQWKYRGGNNWGALPNGTSGLGIGPQEEFYNCADISIIPNEEEVSTTTEVVTTATMATSTISLIVETTATTSTTTTIELTELLETTTIPITPKKTSTMSTTTTTKSTTSTTTSTTTTTATTTTTMPTETEQVVGEDDEESSATIEIESSPRDEKMKNAILAQILLKNLPKKKKPTVLDVDETEQDDVEQNQQQQQQQLEYLKPIMFGCGRLEKPLKKSSKKGASALNPPYQGSLYCHLIGDTQVSCKECYEGCSTPFKTCPEKDCHCKWYA